MHVHRAASVQQAATMMATLGPGARLLAGGTDILIQLRRGALACEHLIDIGRIAGLDGIAIDGEAVQIGALTRHRTIERHAGFAGSMQALIEASRVVGGWQVRNMATIGGNVANASPAADLVPVLLALDATVELAGPAEARHLPLSQFLLGPRRTAARRDEVLTAFRFTPPTGRHATAFLKAGRRKAMEISIVNVAALLEVDDAGRCRGARLALGAVGPVAFRATDAEACLQNRMPSDEAFEEAGRAAAAASNPIDDVRASAAYRRHLVGRLTVRALRLCRDRLQEAT
ncbi:MAG: xanthine dehydrogenase family protein subunit M [Rhodospirillales bacterium]|nr:xanthine dehydrogenase family protein subunit M [Rhodospirillales bacterium]